MNTSRLTHADTRPELLIFCGAFGLIGAIAMTLGVVVLSALSPDHDPLRHTISDLARGDTAWTMDRIFYLNAASLLALAIAGAHLHLGRWDWSLGLVSLCGASLVVALLGVWDAFGQTARGDGMAVHTQLSTLLFPAFLAGPALMLRGIARLGRTYVRLFGAAAVLWPLFALLYFFGPAAYAGLLERFAGGATLLWTLPLSWAFVRQGRAATRAGASRRAADQDASAPFERVKARLSRAQIGLASWRGA